MTRPGHKRQYPRMGSLGDCLDELVPEAPEAELSLTDLVDLETLQRIQDAFAAATGVASAITTPQGTFITRPSNFSRLCQDIVRGTAKGFADCRRSDATFGRPDQNGPVVGICQGCGLWDAGASIFVGERQVANWLIGQVRNEEVDEERALRYADEIGVPRDEFAAAYQEVTVMPTEQFRQVAESLFLMANQISQQAYQRLQMAELLEKSRAAEERLRASEERYQSVMEATQDALWDWDLVTGEGYVSPRYYGMLGIKPGDVEPCYDTWRSLVHPDDAAFCDGELHRHLAGETELYEAEYRMQAADGSWRWIRSRGRVVARKPDGSPVRMVGTHVDITDYRWKAEREVESQLQFQRSQRFESMGVLAGGVAHDFNNHLMSIMGNLELAALELPTDSPALEFLNEAMLASQQSAKLCRQMLAYAGRTAMRVSQVDLAELLRDTSSLIQAAAGGHATVDIAIPPVFPEVRADALEIQQVLMNLVTNAVEAVDGVNANVSVSAHAAWCHRERLRQLCFGEVLTEGTYAFLRVTDNGCGMEPEVLDKAFEPFFTTKFQGRGLGLAASLGIARALGGSISLRSEPGKGTVAELILPVAEGQEVNAEEPLRPASIGDEEWRGQGRILVVDDDLPVRDVACKMLERAGFEVVLAESGRQALELFGDMRGSLRGVLLDWAMPDMNGDKVLQELRRIDASVPVVLTTGYSQSELAEVLSEGQLSGIVHKPFSYERLRSVMRTATTGTN